MVVVSLTYAFVGEPGGVFGVKIDDSAQVWELKQKVKDTNEDIKVPAKNLRLFLAKTGDAWLLSNDPDVVAMRSGGVSEQVKEMLNQEIDPAEEVGDLFGGSPTKKVIHVLVEVPSSEGVQEIILHEDLQKENLFQATDGVQHQHMVEHATNELELYRHRGNVIQETCPEYCEEVLEKINELFRSTPPLPFICVEGSSGMGKSQLAFSLQGTRPWFYLLASLVGVDSQNLYKNFFSVSSWFYKFVMRDLAPEGSMVRAEVDTLKSNSALYSDDSLWTYGFIRALLNYCRMDEHYGARMIHFENKAILHVSKCNREAVRGVCREMTQEHKLLPFFILDEMTANANTAAGGKNTAAFQRNVFRVCGLVVIVMGTDSKISNLVDQSQGSYSENKHKWMSVVPRFPPYQVVFHTTEDKKVWDTIAGTFPVLNDIAAASRGRFARYFVEEVLKYMADHRTVSLCTLLDETFGGVCLRTHQGKNFMSDKKGKYAQVMAISYTNAGRPSKKQRIDEGTDSMHLHFANLVDTHVTDVFLVKKELTLDNGEQWKPLCRFPAMEEDLLLYLAILGGKSYSGYYNPRFAKNHSTKMVFLEYMGSNGFPVDENSKARSNSYKTFENMIAHAIFCASRRNGVVGIPFDDFFGWLLGEIRDDLTKVKMTLHSKSTLHSESTLQIVASDLFDGYMSNMSSMTIPFLTPPNARWPQCILNLNTGSGCTFGHLVRARNTDRCDVYVEGKTKTTALLLCECKYWSKKVDISTMRSIIKGLNDAWKWRFVLVFCLVSADFRAWKETKIGCVKINSQNGHVEWKFHPGENDREKLVIIVETGVMRCNVPT